MNKALSKSLRFYFVIATSIVLIYSCKKEITYALLNEKPIAKNIEWAVEYYDKNLKQENFVEGLVGTSGKISSANNQKHNNLKTLHWQKAKADKNSLYDFVETDLTYTYKVTPTFKVDANPNATPIADKEVINASFDRLIIFKGKDGTINQRIISYVPDNDYAKKHKGNITSNRINKLDSDFFGYLHIKSWNGNPLYILRIENGKAINRYENIINLSNKVLIPSSNSKGKVSVVDSGGGSGGNCLYLVSWDWEQVCYYGTSDIFPIYCDEPTVTNVNYVATSCVGSSIDCTDMANFFDFRCLPQGAGGIESEMPTVQEKNAKFVREIDATKLMQCMKKVLDSLKKNTDDIPDIIRKFSGQDPNYNWTMEDGALAADKFGETSHFDVSTKSVKTIFDGDKFIGATDLYVAGTILHEAIHAYLTTYFGTDRVGAYTNYKDMINAFFTLKDTNSAHHWQIAETFLPKISAALEKYGNMRGYTFESASIKSQFYSDLAWAGLEGTSAFTSLTITQQNRIKDVVFGELEGKDHIGNSKAAKGALSTCLPR